MAKSPFSKAAHQCGSYDPCQIPEKPTSVCYTCGWLRSAHFPLTLCQRDVVGALRVFGHKGLSEMVESDWLSGTPSQIDSRLGVPAPIVASFQIANLEAATGKADRDRDPSCSCPASPHTCPHRSEISDDKTPCTCCEHCEQKCRDDI